MNKNKDININPAKGISIVIKNEFQPPVPKKKRKYKRKIRTDLLKMPTVPSFIPTGDVSYIKPQYSTSSLNRSMIFPGVPQSLPQLPPPPPLPQLMPPPPLPLLMPPPPGAPVNISFDNMFGGMLDMMMPREYGFKQNSYAVDMLDEDVMNALPQDQQDLYIENKLAPQIEKEMKDLKFANEEDKKKVSKEILTIKSAKQYGTKNANNLKPYDETRYQDNEYYKTSYVNRLQEIISQDSLKTRAGNIENTKENKAKAIELLKAIGIRPEYVPPPPTIAEIPKAKAEKPKPAPPPAPAPAPAPVVDKPKPAPAPPPAAVAEKPKPPPVVDKPKPPPPPPVAAAAGKGPPPPPPPPPPKPAISSDLLNDLEDTKEEKDAKAKAAKLAEEGAKKGDMMDEIRAQQERAPKQAGTKNGKALSDFTEKYVDNLHYRKNYKAELEKHINDEKTSDENKAKAKALLDGFDKELIRRAKEYAIKDTSIDTLYSFRTEYKEFKKEYSDPYMKKMKEYQDETTQKLEDAKQKLSEYKELDKHENRKTLTADQKKKLNKKLDVATETVTKFKEFLDRINEYSGLK